MKGSGLGRIGLGISIVGAAGLSLACAEEESRPPPIVGCSEDCRPGGNGNTPGQGGGGGTGGTGGSAGGVSATTIEGEFFVYNDNFAPGTAPVLDAVEVQAPAPDGSLLSQNFDPPGFSLEGVAAAPGVWIGARTITGSLELLPTVQIYDTSSGASLFLPFVQRSTLELISNLLTQPVVFDSSAAHVVMHFVDEGNADLPGVSLVSNSGAERIVYDAAGSWTDAASGTGDSGFVVLLNVASSADFPGSEQLFSVQTADGEVVPISAPIAGGTVTLFDVALTGP